jgi:very-short-patch-repair endonuclease
MAVEASDDVSVASVFQSGLPLRAKLDRARTDLLDLSTRNRLLNVPLRSKVARSIEVVDELSSEVLRLLVREGKTFTFLPGRAASGEAEDSANDKAPDGRPDDEIAVLAQPDDDPVDKRGVAQRHSDTRLQTRLTSEGLQRRLLDLCFDARTLQEEQGVNILFLALGLLKWREAPSSEVDRHAPLLLVPVALERGTAAEKFRLRWIQEDVAGNLSLETFLDRLHGLTLPMPGDPDTFDPAGYFAEVAACIAGKPGWEVLPDSIVLGFFSFAKFMMYRDLGPDNWPVEAGLTDQPLVRALLSDGFGSESQLPDDTPVDPLVGPMEMLHIVDADSSQTLAIHEVRRGGNLVIQGPPGTGKSQTIANIIGSAVADGKTVLFVAEKMAALEVVKRRLDTVGIGDICLELHSNKANKRLVLEELKRTWELGHPRGESDRALLRRLESCRDALNDHVARMHHLHDVAQLSPYHVIGHLVRLQQAGQGPVDIRLDRPETWTREDKAQREEMLRDLARRIADMGLPCHHPWRGVALEVILPTDRDRLSGRIAGLVDRLGGWLGECRDLAAAVEADVPEILTALDVLLDRVRIVAAAPDLTPQALTAAAWTGGGSAIAGLINTGFAFERLYSEIGAAFVPEAWVCDLGTVPGDLMEMPAGFGAAEMTSISNLDQKLARLLADDDRLWPLFDGIERGETLTGLDRAFALAERAAAMPGLDPAAIASAVWDRPLDDVAELVDAVRTVREARADIKNTFNDTAWSTDVAEARRVLAAHGTGLFRRFSGAWRRADRLVRSLLAAPDMPALPQLLDQLDTLASAQRALVVLAELDAVGQEAFGSEWRRQRSDIALLEAALDWMRSLRPLGMEIRHAAVRVTDRPLAGELARRARPLLDEVQAGLTQLFDRLADGNAAPFGPGAVASRVELARLKARLTAWANADGQCRELMVDCLDTLGERTALLARLAEGQGALGTIRGAESLGWQAFGPLWQAEASEWERLAEAADWIWNHEPLRAIAARQPGRAALAGRADAVAQEGAALARDIETLWRHLRFSPAEVFDTTDVQRVPLPPVLEQLTLWHEHIEQLSRWIAWCGCATRAGQAGLGDLVGRMADGRIGGDAAVPMFERACYEALFADMVRHDPELARFDGDAQSRLVQDFADLDRQRIDLARLEVVIAHHQRIPKGGGAAGPLGILRGEMARRRGHMPIRQLMHKAGPAIQSLKPVFMMSPLSVAQFLPPSAITFDLLVMDEASQVQPVDALGAIARCRQMVVVGDERQLPPTRFFSRMIGGDGADDDETGAAVADMESILGLCQARGLPQRMLRWHYRSRHQSLIAVSNSQFYDNRLFIVPSPYSAGAGMGLRLHHLPHGVFDSGNTGTNVVEARAVAEAIIRHAVEHPKLSLGVAAFSVRQRRAILDELERLRRLNPDTESFFTGRPDEPFFVKNLENIQGDERDVIFISVGYGRNAQGNMAMRFGPLSSEGGERRLNVLISRAKRRCEVFSSITDEDIDTERGKGRGVFAFKLFLHFARTGRLAMGVPTDREHDSVFEEQVARALQGLGYDVHPQVGLAGFFIDLAIADPDRPGRFVLGIECDGASYHSSRSARDRDRLRQAVLEDHGWIIHRIWSTDWFQRPQEQLKRTVAAIEAAKAELDARLDRGTASHERAVPIEIVTIDRHEVTEIGLVPETGGARLYQEAGFPVPSATYELHEVPLGLMAELVCNVVKVEGPVHHDEIVARLRTLWGLQRAGGRIQSAVERGIATAVREGRILDAEDFCAVLEGEVGVRDRSAVASLTLRKPEMLPPMEIQAAALMFVRANMGAARDELVQGMARLFGFKATSAQLRAVLEAQVDGMLAGGVLEMRGEMVAVSGENKLQTVA